MLVIVDYNMGNLHSVKRKLDQLGVPSCISSDPKVIRTADKLILPGVGHFGQAMENLRTLGLLDALHEAVQVKKTPILGICLGMQLLARYSEEGHTAGLGWIDAEVVAFQFADRLRYKVPHTGWNTVHIAHEHPVMAGIPQQAACYFVHAYYFRPNNSADVLTYTDYGIRFASAVASGHILGMQYHPEKSHGIGLAMLRNFAEADFSHMTPVMPPVEHAPVSEASGLQPRVIPVLLLRDAILVKTRGFKKPTYIGDPINAVRIFNDLKADELVFLDTQATEQGRLVSLDFVRHVGEEADMPFAVGGGIRRLDDIRSILAAGAEKVVITSYALERPTFIAEAAAAFGSSTIVVCIDVKKKWLGGTCVWSAGATKASPWSPVAFAQEMERQGAGELIIQSVEHDGAMTGYDLALVRSISEAVSIPVVALGGAGTMEHLRAGFTAGFANGLAGGSMFVYHGRNRGVLITYPEPEEKVFPR